MNLKKKYVRVVPFVFLMIIGLFGCSGKEETPVQQQEEAEDQVETETETQTQPQTDTVDIEEPVAEKEKKERGFETSEEAVLDYLAGLRDNDFGRMEDSFLVKGSAADIVNQYVYLCEIDLIPEVAAGSYIDLREDGDAEAFLEQLTGQIEAADFENMEFLGFFPMDDIFDSADSNRMAAYQKMLDITAENNGGSELKSEVAAVQMNGTSYLLFFDTIKADDKWYVFQLGGILLNLAGAEEKEVIQRLETEDEEILAAIMDENADTYELPESAAAMTGRDRMESEGFDTPEEAVTAYLEALKVCDIERMLGTFSVESYGENYNMQAYLEHVQAYMFLQQDVTVPAVNDFTKAMISCEREAQLRENMLGQGNALYLWSCYYNGTEPEQDVTYGWEELQEKLDLDSIEVVEFILPETIAEKSGSEQVNEIRDQQAGICGAEGQQDCVAVFTCGGEKYCLFMEAMQYNDRWYNSDFGNFAYSSLGGASYMRGTLPYEALEYAE